MQIQIFFIILFFFPSAIRAWNSLPEEIKQAPSVASFKYRLNRNNQSPPLKYFNAGSRIGQILHSRLRMKCSSLNSHLYRRNIVESLSCTCGSFEVPITSYLNVQNIVKQEIGICQPTCNHLAHEIFCMGKKTLQILKLKIYFSKFKSFLSILKICNQTSDIVLT